MYKTKIHIEELEAGDYHSIVLGSVAGQKIRIVIDTGASHSCMDTTFAKQLIPNLYSEEHDGVTAGIGGDNFEVRIAHIPNFKLGRLTLQNFENMALIDFTYINQAYQRLHKKPIQMILGNDFLVLHKALLDYKAKLLFFEK